MLDDCVTLGLLPSGIRVSGGLLMASALGVPVFGGLSLEDPCHMAEFIVDLILNGLRNGTVENEEEG